MADDNLSKIVEALRDRKISDLKNELKALKDKQVLESVDLFQKLEEEETEEKIQTGTLIDDVIGGGLPPKSSLLLYGEYGSGKSQTCYTICVECPDTVVVIDAENSFRAQRIRQICEARGKDFKKVFEKIILKQPKNWVQQLRCLYSLPAPSDTPTGKIGLIIVDSLTKAFRGIEFQGRQSLYIKQPLIREFALKITNMVKDFNAGLVITTQIYEDVNTPTFLADWTKIKAVGGPSLLHQPDFVVFLRRVKGQNVRVARMMDSSWQPLREAAFVITDKGIENLPEDAKAKEALLKKAAAFELRQKQEEIIKKEKKKKPDDTERQVDKMIKEAQNNEPISPESTH